MAKKPEKNGGKPPIDKAPFDLEQFLENEGLDSEPKIKTYRGYHYQKHGLML